MQLQAVNIGVAKTQKGGVGMTDSLEKTGLTPHSRTVSRRGFLKLTAAGVAGTMLTSLASASEGPQFGGLHGGTSSLDGLGKSAFARHIGQVFRFRKDAYESVDLELIEVSDLVSRSRSSSDDSFSMVFRGARDHPLHQATYSVGHRSLGTFPLFVVPIYPEADALNYEAVFNRMEA
jgi:hypothetical protein